MKYTICFITILLNFLLDLHAGNKNDSLLKVLDKVISDRMVYTEKKAITLKELKLKKAQQKTLEKLYRLNTEIIHQYETFVCDSAEQYIHENIALAQKMAMKSTCWRAGFNWHLYIPYRACLFRLMIFSNLSILIHCPTI